MKFRWSFSRKLLIIPPILVGIGILAGFLLTRQGLPRKEIEEVALPIAAIKIQPRQVIPLVSGYGTAKAAQTWTAISEVKGRVVEIHPDLDSGKPISKNEVLFKIDKRDYILRLNQRQSDLNATQAQLSELKAAQKADKESLAIEQDLLELNQSEAERVRKLLSQNAVSPSDYDAARGVVLRQRQQVQRLKNTLALYPSKIASATAAAQMAQAKLDEAQRDVDRTTVVAPFSGVLSGVKLEKNQIVGQGERLFDLLQIETVEIESQFSLSQLSRLGSFARFADSTSDATTNLKKISARVITRSGDWEIIRSGTPVRISESVNEQTRTLGIVIQVENFQSSQTDKQNSKPTTSSIEELAPGIVSTNPVLKPGTFCEVQLAGEPVPDAITVPRTAIDQGHVYVVDEESRLRRRRVEAGIPLGKEILVRNGLSAGDIVAIKPPTPAIDGRLVTPDLELPKSSIAPPESASNEENRGGDSVAPPNPFTSTSGARQ